jgi:mannitol/fructose-specific phosphotransferase system IIA component (Ntr-type)
MKLAGLLAESHVCIGLNADEREGAVRELLGQLVESGEVEANELERLVGAVVRRERLGTTAIGRGVAVPHARVEGAGQTVVAIGLSEHGVEFEALDREPVHTIFLVIGPKEAVDEYLAVMKSVSSLIQNEDFRRFLRQVHTPREVVDLVEEMER